MYGFRKPFTAATYPEPSLGGLDEKTVLVVAQVLGYTASKFLGIKVVAEASSSRRVTLLLTLIGAACAALLLFGLTPTPWNAIWLFVNGLMLGMVFGLVLGFLEGRRHTEALAAGLCGSFIVADGLTKSLGSALLETGVSDRWMPFVAGLVFAPGLVIFAWMLARVPAPSARDVAERSERMPMDSAQRWAFFHRYAVGLVLVIAIYLLVTILRSARADFAPEIWQGLQGGARPALFTYSETVVAIVVLAMTGAVVLIRNNRRAFFAGLGLAGVGALIAGGGLLAFQTNVIGAFAFMVLLGVGLYLPYIVVHTILFERLLATTRDRGNIGYLMYLADSFGYLGYVAVLLARVIFRPTGDFLAFFFPLCWIVVAGCIIFMIPCWIYFAAHHALRPKASVA